MTRPLLLTAFLGILASSCVTETATDAGTDAGSFDASADTGTDFGVDASRDGGGCCPSGSLLFGCTFPDGGSGYACHDPALGCASSLVCGAGCDTVVDGWCDDAGMQDASVPDAGGCCPVGWSYYDCTFDDGGMGHACHDPRLGCASSLTCGEGCDFVVTARCGV